MTALPSAAGAGGEHRRFHVGKLRQLLQRFVRLAAVLRHGDAGVPAAFLLRDAPDLVDPQVVGQAAQQRQEKGGGQCSGGYRPPGGAVAGPDNCGKSPSTYALPPSAVADDAAVAQRDDPVRLGGQTLVVGHQQDGLPQVAGGSAAAGPGSRRCCGGPGCRWARPPAAARGDSTMPARWPPAAAARRTAAPAGRPACPAGPGWTSAGAAAPGPGGVCPKAAAWRCSAPPSGWGSG